MPKLYKKVHKNEDLCDKLHKEMNAKVGPTRKEPLNSFPVYLFPDLDPMQKQLNRIENTVNYEARCRSRRNWKCNK